MKKVLSIISLCLIGVLAACIIIFSTINTNYNLNLTNPDYIEVSINNTNAKQSYYSNGDAGHKEVYDKIMQLYNDSFKQKIMSGIFSGVLFNKPTIIYSSSSVNGLLNNGTYIIFNYNNEQTLTLNGQVYTYTSSSGTKTTDIKYNKIYVEVKNTNSITNFNIYVKNLNNDYSYYHYSVQARQADLYSYIQENFA